LLLGVRRICCSAHLFLYATPSDVDRFYTTDLQLYPTYSCTDVVIDAKMTCFVPRGENFYALCSWYSSR
jgi:hypothetical protein